MKRKKPQPSKRSRPSNPYECVVDTEGVQYVLDWSTFPINGFVFMKCVETTKVITILRRSSARHGISLALRVGIRNGYWGVGIWRTR